MNILLTHQKVQVDVQHYRCVGHKNMLHIVILIRSVLVPNKVPNESSNHKSVSTYLLQEVALTFEHIVWGWDCGSVVFGLYSRLSPVKGNALAVDCVSLAFYLR